MKKTRERKTHRIDLKKPHFKGFYYVLFIFFAFTFFCSIFMSNGTTLRAALFQDASDTFMDHYNSVVYNGVDDPYEILVVYPPLASLLYRICYLIIPKDNYGAIVTDPSELAQEREIRLDQTFVFQFIIYWVLAILIFLAALSLLKKGSAKEKILFCAVTLLSSPFLYMLDRGNNVILPVAFSILFLVFYNHENKVLREFSLVFLAIAVGLKIYPIAFLVLILADRRYKDFLKECVYIFALLILPFFIFYNGFSSIKLMIKNILGFDIKRTTEDNIDGQLDFKRVFFFLYGGSRRFTGITISDKMREVYANVCRYGISAVCGLGAVFSKKQWKRVALLCAVIYGFPGSASTYILLFMAIPTAMFLDEEKTPSVKNYLYLLCLLIAQAPLIVQRHNVYSRYWPTKVSSFAVVGFVFIAFIEGIVVFIKWNENRSREGKPFFRTAGKTVADYLRWQFMIPEGKKKAASAGPELPESGDVQVPAEVIAAAVPEAEPSVGEGGLTS